MTKETSIKKEPAARLHPYIKNLKEISMDMRPLVGGKAIHLAELSRNGLPVPAAYVVTAEAYRQYDETGSLPQDLLQYVENLRRELGGKVAVRSSATCEDGTNLSMAGVFETYYLTNGETVESAIEKIYHQASSSAVAEYLELHGLDSEDVEMAVILQRLVEPDISGVMYTGLANNQALIEYAEGFGASLVDGDVDGSSLLYDQNSGSIIKSKKSDVLPITSESVAELQAYAQRIQDLFEGNAQDIEFAIQGDSLYILQARTLTAEFPTPELEITDQDVVKIVREQFTRLVNQEKAELGTNNVIFSDGNYSELLPRPKEMDHGIFAYIFTGSDGIPGAIQLGRKQMGYPIGNASIGYTNYLGGKPYFSIARDAHNYYAGFPESLEEYNNTLVQEYLQQIEEDPAKGEYPEMGVYLQDPTIEDLVQRYGKKGAEYYKTYLAFKARMTELAKTFLHEYLSEGKPETDSFIAEMEAKDLDSMTVSELGAYIEDVLEHLRTVSCVHFVKSARLGFYYSQRLQQSLKYFFRMNESDVEQTFAVLTQGLEGSEITDANIKIARAYTLEEALKVGERVVGHYSTSEMLEIRHPRLKDDPHALHQYVEAIFVTGAEYEQNMVRQQEIRAQKEQELTAQLTNKDELAEYLEVINSAQKYMALRETVKYQFVKEYALIRDALVRVEQHLGMEEGSIFSLFPREIKDLIDNPERFTAKIKERQELFSRYSEVQIPPVVLEQDIPNIDIDDHQTIDALELLGKLLAMGKVLENAIIVNVDDFETVDAAREILAFYKEQALPIVLVASQMNLSHDPLIVQADGVIIENANLVSHGAQRARELGRGAIGGIKSRAFKTGETVIFDPSMRKVSRVR